MFFRLVRKDKCHTSGAFEPIRKLVRGLEVNYYNFLLKGNFCWPLHLLRLQHFPTKFEIVGYFTLKPASTMAMHWSQSETRNAKANSWIQNLSSAKAGAYMMKIKPFLELNWVMSSVSWFQNWCQGGLLDGAEVREWKTMTIIDVDHGIWFQWVEAWWR